VATAGKSNALIFRSSVGCVYRATMRVELWPEIAITDVGECQETEERGMVPATDSSATRKRE
jgi:hypothetical protein